MMSVCEEGHTADGQGVWGLGREGPRSEEWEVRTRWTEAKDHLSLGREGGR